jgi:DNA (cytosine-5)-methyltransferase 3A
MKVLSLFDGISCGMVALERAKIPVERYVAYEIEPNAIKISKKNYPQIEHCGDVTTADFLQYKGSDLLIGGSPCQSLSIVQSQTRQHLDGKSKLFFEYVRAKEQTQPRYFLFENVASMNDESKQAISNCLGCKPIFIDSADFSAQDRPRLYWTNIPVLLNYEKSKAVLRDVLEENVDDKYFYNCSFDLRGLDKKVCAILNINGHDILKRVNNPDFKCQTLTTCGGGNTQKKVYIDGRVRKLTPLEYERLQTLPDGYTEGVSNSHRYNAIGNGWTVDVIAHIFKNLKTN